MIRRRRGARLTNGAPLRGAPDLSFNQSDEAGFEYGTSSTPHPGHDALEIVSLSVALKVLYEGYSKATLHFLHINQSITPEEEAQRALFKKVSTPLILTRNHKEAGYVSLVIKRELRDELDKLRVKTPWGKETRPDVIRRLIKKVTTPTEEPRQPISKRKKGGVKTLEEAIAQVQEKRRRKAS